MMLLLGNAGPLMIDAKMAPLGSEPYLLRSDSLLPIAPRSYPCEIAVTVC